MKTILFLTSDLMMQSSASAAARDQGIKFRACRSVERLVERMGEETVAGIFIDLQTPDLSLPDLRKALSIENAPRTLAFAQHVEEQLLADAQMDCIEAVLTRGQFSRELPNLIAQLCE